MPWPVDLPAGGGIGTPASRRGGSAPGASRDACVAVVGGPRSAAGSGGAPRRLGRGAPEPGVRRQRPVRWFSCDHQAGRRIEFPPRGRLAVSARWDASAALARSADVTAFHRGAHCGRIPTTRLPSRPRLVSAPIGREHPGAPPPRQERSPANWVTLFLPLAHRTSAGRLGLHGLSCHGSVTSIPVSWKSLTLRVASVAPCARQIAAICASNPSIGTPARSRELTIPA